MVFKRKRVKRVKRAKKYGNAVARPVAGLYGAFLAPRITTKLKYHDSFSINATSGIMNDYIYRLNSIFDPDYTGGGHQPLGRDNLANLYNRYRVDKVVATIVFNKASEGVCVGHAIVGNNADTAFTNPWSAITEQAMVKYRVGSNSTAGSATRITLKRTFNLNKIVGVTMAKYKADDAYSSIISTNPTEAIMLHIINVDILGSTSSTTVVSVNLTYFVEFFDPFVVSQS